jgi:Zn-dependent protease with chaperone function
MTHPSRFGRRRAIQNGFAFSFGLAARLRGQTAEDDLDPVQQYVGSALTPYNTGYYAGYKTPLVGDVARRFAPLAKRADPGSRIAIFLVEAPTDRKGQPKAQLALSCSFSVSIDDRDYGVIFLTRYLKDGLTDGQLLAVLAHEAGHFRQTREYRIAHPDDTALKRFRFSKALEADADAWALAAPEVDPRDFKAMIIAADRLNDLASRKHPGLFKSALGTTALIPYSVEARLGMGWDHPTSGSRIKAAEQEIRDRGL